ncbi:tea3 [Symbiodinium sp. CCMP2592]|nr:tea3 [Symbiodinium sp. CCMP2592]
MKQGRNLLVGFLPPCRCSVCCDCQSLVHGQDLLAIPDSTGHSASDLLAIKDRLQQQLSRNLHAEPNDADYVNHEDTSKAFLSEVSTMLEHFKTSRRLNKADSPLLEYATMSGAGKTRWGFHVERLLKAELPDCAILRVGLNFNGGSGGGDADRTEAVHLLSTQNFSDQQTMACLLFARGLLQCSPDAVRHFAAWLRGLTTPDVLDALFESAPEADTRILVVHLDELAMLLKETRLGFTDKNLKEFVNNLADYNCGQRPLGLVVPVITHTSPVIWDPETTTIPLKRMNLGPFSFAESLKFFQGINVTDLDSLLAISACGGHAALLVEMRKFMGRKSGGLGPLITCSRLDLHRKSVKAMGMSKQECISLLKAILLQQVVLEDKIRRYSQKGLLFLEDDDGRYRVSVPYPCLLNLLEVLDRPGRFENLRWTGNTPAKSRWRTKAFEALCAIRIAIEMKDFPYDSPRDPNTVATTFVREKKSCVCLAKKQNEAGVDAIGVDGGTMILLQCKYPEMDSTAQDWKEVEQFMNFTAKTGVEWAKKAGCNQIRAIFATGRAPRNYTSTRPTELEVDGVHISYTVYAKTENRKDCAIRAMPISTWIPSSVMCF